MGGFSFGKSTQDSNATSIQTDSSQHQSDNRVAVQSAGSLIATGGGALTQKSGIEAGAGSTITVSSIDPGSYAFASHVVDQSMKANADVVSGAGGVLSKAVETVSQLAQGTPIGTTDWKKYLVPGAVVLALILGVVVWSRGRK